MYHNLTPPGSPGFINHKNAMKINIDFNTDNYYEERKIDKRTHLYKHLVYLGLFSKLGHVADWFPFGRLLWYTNIKQQKFLLESYLENQN